MKKTLKKTLRFFFDFFQHLGFNLLPNHFYSNVPNFKLLNNQVFWKKPMSMIGVNGNDIKKQLSFTKKCVNSLSKKALLENFRIIKRAIDVQQEIGFGVIEADFLFCFINHIKPKKVIQIGCGVSTSIIMHAAKLANYSIDLTCIEPYPSNYLRKLDRKNEIHLISEIAQTVPIDQLLGLNDGDLFFVDSTHTVKTGSEVNRIILEILPRLNKGVYVHFHDIYFPYDYQRDIKTTLLFWNESTLLHSFLINNNNYTIRVSQSMLHYSAKESLKRLFPNYNPQTEDYGIANNRTDFQNHFPASTYLQVI